MSRRTRLRVAICGGGISGLCLAIALAQYPDINVQVFEAAERFKEIGAGVMIWSRTWHILTRLGLGAEFSRIAHAPPDGSNGVGFDFRRSDMSTEGSQFLLVEMPYGCIRFHRAEFLDVLVDNLPPGVAHFGKRLMSYRQDSPHSPVHLQFAGGSTSTCDLLVGCDGIKSCVRGQMMKSLSESEMRPEYLDYVDPVWTGTIAYRGLIPVKRLQADERSPHRAIQRPMMYCGKGKHVVSYSISQGSIVNVVTFASKPEKDGSHHGEPWVTECSQQELLECYADWEPEVESLLKCIDKPTRWAIHHLRPLPLYVAGRVALVGDAAHAMSPHQGAGAGQAIEDAYILSRVLGIADISTLDAALLAYQHVRLPAAYHVLKGSYESGTLYEFNSRLRDDYVQLGPAIERQWSWINNSSVDEDSDRAVQYMVS
ncbi:FAD/NAD-P-binding domain-containing protein [Infundibulicybe gibba]|nr:FAD/NAD-P-binding domain-containing protein [Infundibulicybe gibba]